MGNHFDDDILIHLDVMVRVENSNDENDKTFSYCRMSSFHGDCHVLSPHLFCLFSLSLVTKFELTNMG